MRKGKKKRGEEEGREFLHMESRMSVKKRICKEVVVGGRERDMISVSFIPEVCTCCHAYTCVCVCAYVYSFVLMCFY